MTVMRFIFFVRWLASILPVTTLLPVTLLLSATSVIANSGLVDISPPTAPHEVPSSVCGGCHQKIYQEWSGSMHANSTALKDPIHGAFYRKVIGDPTKEGVTKKGKYPICLRCHAPNAAMQGKTKLDSKVAFNEGVNCIYCHTITGFKGTVKKDGKLRLGQAAYTNSTSKLQAPSGINYTTSPTSTDANAITGVTQPFHPFPMEAGNVAVMRTNDLCMGCHDQRKNFHGVPLCATGTEIEDSGSTVTCQSCHMPMVGGHANHSMMGGHSVDMVRRGVVMTMDVDKQKDSLKATVSIKNLLPHKFPTGAPFRNVYIKIGAYDAKGTLLWQNFKTHPLQDDVKSVLFYKLGDGEGNPAMPPKAKEILSDTRIEPHATKIVEYDIPHSSEVKLVKAELLYNLLLPKLVKQLDSVLTDDLKAPKLAATAEKWM